MAKQFTRDKAICVRTTEIIYRWVQESSDRENQSASAFIEGILIDAIAAELKAEQEYLDKVLNFDNNYPPEGEDYGTNDIDLIENGTYFPIDSSGADLTDPFIAAIEAPTPRPLHQIERDEMNSYKRTRPPESENGYYKRSK